MKNSYTLLLLSLLLLLLPVEQLQAQAPYVEDQQYLALAFALAAQNPEMKEEVEAFMALPEEEKRVAFQEARSVINAFRINKRMKQLEFTPASEFICLVYVDGEALIPEALRELGEREYEDLSMYGRVHFSFTKDFKGAYTVAMMVDGSEAVINKYGTKQQLERIATEEFEKAGLHDKTYDFIEVDESELLAPLYDTIVKRFMEEGMPAEGSEEGLSEEDVVALKEEFMAKPHWHRAALVLKKFLDDKGFYNDVTIDCGGSDCKVRTSVAIAENATIEQETTFHSGMEEEQLMDMLRNIYKVPYFEAEAAFTEGISESFWNYMRIQDAKIARQEGWLVAYAEFTADLVTAPTGVPTIYGWITGNHWRTGNELKWWEQVLGAFDVIPGEALAKAGITALVIKIGNKVFDFTKVATATRSFLVGARQAGLKVVMKGTNEVILYGSQGIKQIGRFADGVLQDIYWNYGGERILAKLAGVKYVIDGKTLDDAIEIVEDGAGNVGARVVGAGIRFTDEIDGLISGLKTKARYVLEGTGDYKTVKGHHPTAKKAFEGDIAYDYNKAFSVSPQKLDEVAGIRNIHGTITGQQNSLYSTWRRANPSVKLTLTDMVQIEIRAMKNAGIPEDIATGWVLKALEDLKAQGVTLITNIPWNGLNK
ncbi:hypothetical protein GCM10011506_44260 [Marivirga lumbricoides]|uniref:Uncharacterized protein n=1 Tax=Marivirga lumbricoides TaxID=1046115 RepID=A0ABQ1NBM9_9BACT|nr:hypothetical protein GCM10011506_44260 [Marivirga lumbricoides]